MNPTAAAVITKNRAASRLRTLPRIKGPLAWIPSSLVLVAEAVADAAHREQILRGSGVALELFAQVTNVNVDRARVAVRRVAPDLLQEHLARLHAPRRAGESGQDLELDVGELHALSPRRHYPPLEVDLQVAGADGLLAAGPGTDHLRASQRRTHAASELPDRERLGDVVVGPHLQAEDLVDLVVLGGEHDDRHLAPA